jgi:iron-sulfur cluster repair protein YtfE (RIC family)
MGIVIGAKPESSFADPLGLLSDCHRRIEKFLQTLVLIVTQVQDATAIADRERKEEDEGGGVHLPYDSTALSEDQRHALEVALRYFREAAPRHTRDEEESLFPKMRACGGAEARATLAAIDALEADHDRADEGHAEVERLGCKWLAEGQLTRHEIAGLREFLEGLQSLYQKHIKIEDTQIFPLAGEVLDAPTIRAVGQEMAARRGIDLDALPDLKLRCPTRRTGNVATE